MYKELKNGMEGKTGGRGRKEMGMSANLGIVEVEVVI